MTASLDGDYDLTMLPTDPDFTAADIPACANAAELHVGRGGSRRLGMWAIDLRSRLPASGAYLIAPLINGKHIQLNDDPGVAGGTDHRSRTSPSDPICASRRHHQQCAHALLPVDPAPMKKRHFVLAAAARRESGRTLVELLVAIVLSLMILAAVGSLYYFTSQSARTSQNVSSAEERGRVAAFHLSEPIALAGYGNINSSEMVDAARQHGDAGPGHPRLRERPFPEHAVGAAGLSCRRLHLRGLGRSRRRAVCRASRPSPRLARRRGR